MYITMWKVNEGILASLFLINKNNNLMPALFWVPPSSYSLMFLSRLETFLDGVIQKQKQNQSPLLLLGTLSCICI